MSQLIIADLNFFESEFLSQSQVKGGLKKPSLDAALDAGLDAALDAKLEFSGTSYKFSAGSAYGAGSAAASSTEGPAKAKVTVKANVNLG